MALTAGMTALVVEPAGAALAKVDVSSHSVTCNDIVGKIKFSTPLTLGGTSPNQVTITLKTTDCVDNTAGVYDATSNPTGVTLKQYSAKGVLNASTNDCLGLSGLSSGTSGTVNGKFVTASGTPGLVSGTNAFTVNQTYGGSFNDGGTTSEATNSDSWGAVYGMFEVGVPSFTPTAAPLVSGAYNNGANGGPSNTFSFKGTTAQSQGSLATACFTTGIKGIQFGIGGFTS
jgi:hypothetical protein